MKRIFLLIALLVSLTVSADMLNGPWSSESHELVDIIQGTKNRVPAKFKDIQDKILILKDLFADSYTTFAINVRVNPRFLELEKSDTVFLEAILQLLKSNRAQENPLKLPAADYAMYHIALLAAQLHDLELFEQAIQESTQKIKVAVLKDVALDFSKNDLIIQDKIGDAAFVDTAQQAYAFDKKLLTILARNIDRETLQKNLKVTITNYDFDNKDRIIFLMSIGGDINRIENRSTLLDKAIKSLDGAKKSHSGSDESQKDFEKMLNIVNFLRSLGAKTYAEL